MRRHPRRTHLLTASCISAIAALGTSPQVHAQCPGIPVVASANAGGGSSSSALGERRAADDRLNLGPAQGNEAFGLINSRGYLAVNRSWEWVDYSYENRIRAVEKGLTGFSDNQGKWVIQPKFVFADRFQDGVAIVGDGKKFGMIDQRGKSIVPVKLDGALRFQEGFAAVQIGEKVGFIDKQGELRIPARLSSARSFHQGFAAFSAPGPDKTAEVKGYLNKKGEVAWYDKAGEVEELGDFNEQLAAVRIEGKWGFLAKSFRVQIKPQFEAVRDFTNGLAAAKLAGKWGFINKRGGWVIDPTFDDVDDFDCSQAMAKSSEGWGFIDKRGQWTIQPQFSYAEPFFRGYARVATSPNFGYISTSGRVMWDPGKAGVTPGPTQLEQKPWLSTLEAGLKVASPSPIGPYAPEHQYEEQLPNGIGTNSSFSSVQP